MNESVLTHIDIPPIQGDYLSGKNAVITGGTSGIGFAIASAFLRCGCANVMITSRTEEKLHRAVSLLKEQHPGKSHQIHGAILRLSPISTIEPEFQGLCRQLPGGSVDIWVNNAGIYKGTRFGTVSEDDFDALMDVNLKSQYFISQIVASHMIGNQTKGNILNMCSSSSYRPSIDPYMLSKLGMSGLTLGMAKKLIEYGIVVNGIAPGPTATPMLRKKPGDDLRHGGVPAGRYVLPEEIANLAVFLVSGMGRMIVGDVVKMTGGSAVTTYDDVRY